LHDNKNKIGIFALNLKKIKNEKIIVFILRFDNGGILHFL